MSHDHGSKLPRPIRFLFDNSVFLIAGAVLALVWANVDPDTKDEQDHVVEQGSYHQFIHFNPVAWVTAQVTGDESHDDKHADDKHNDDKNSDDQNAGEPQSGEPSTVSKAGVVEPASKHDGHEAHGSVFQIQHFVNDLLMALFFAIAAKEVWEALLPGGALSNPRKAAVPLIATVGGIVGPAGLYIAGVLLLNVWQPSENHWVSLGNGWAVPCATDIAFSYLVARIIFGVGHPAIAFLLLLAIADDAAGLIILAVFYPSGDLNPWWLLLSVAAIGVGFGFRKLRLKSFWWYLLIPGAMSWIAFHNAGIHAALGLVPIIPTMPHAHTDLGIFAREELKRNDTLNEFEHWWKYPVEIVLGIFGLVNAGVVLGNVGAGTAMVLIGLLIGKPLGITFFTWLAEKGFKLEVPGGMSYRDVVSLGMVAGIGFTVALFVTTAAFKEPGFIQDSVKMGALGSFFAAVLAYLLARALGIRPLKPASSQPNDASVDDKELAEVG